MTDTYVHTFEVRGVPAPQGSHHAFAVKKGGAYTGKTVMVDDSAKTRPWREAVKAGVFSLHKIELMTGPVAIEIEYRFPRPKYHYRTGKLAHELRPGAPKWHTMKPDVDKLERSTLDGITDGHAWADDAQVAHITASKRYINHGEHPGATVRMWEIR